MSRLGNVTADGINRRDALALRNMKSNKKRVGVPQHSSRGFDEKTAKYFSELEEHLKDNVVLLGHVKHITEQYNQTTETLRNFEIRLLEVEARADAAGI